MCPFQIKINGTCHVYAYVFEFWLTDNNHVGCRQLWLWKYRFLIDNLFLSHIAVLYVALH